MAAGGYRLSGLSDDLLRRVLHFVPAREGASSSVLSRRWRPLWRSCRAINLEARVDRKNGDAVVSAAHKALDAADKAAEANGDGPIRKLTIRLEASSRDKIREFLYPKNHNVFAVALSHQTARRVEELRIAAVDTVDGKPMFFERSKYEASSGGMHYRLVLGSLPSETLRVLELTNCSVLKQPASSAIAFPRLASLRLRHCDVPLEVLQVVSDAAPVLALIHLDSVLLEDDEKCHPRSRRSLCCPAATTLVLDKCCLKEESSVEIYAPMLRRFRYRGVDRHILLSPPPPNLTCAELTLIEHGSVRDRDPSVALESFWGTVHGFRHAKELKVRVRHLEEIATTNETRPKLLPKLRSLERLELQGVYTPTRNKAPAAVIADLLHCCPALCDLRINLSTSHEDTNKQYDYGLDFLKRKYRSQLEESIHRFKRRRPQPTVAGDEQDDVNYNEVSDLPGLSDHSFKCLRRRLRRVGLQFRRERTDCFGIKLIKFFAEHAKVLEEMCIDAGNERIHDHMNPKIEKWIANSSKRMIDSATATKIQVLSLTRSN